MYLSNFRIITVIFSGVRLFRSFTVYVLGCSLELVRPSFDLSLLLTEPNHNKTNKMAVRPAKTQISLGI